MEAVVALLKQDMLDVEDQFRRNLATDVDLINKVGDYVLSSGGKRFRPMLLLLSAKLCNYSGDKHIELAAVVEFIHTATLLHDDVRGQRTVCAVATVRLIQSGGIRPLVLVGDFLFSKSFSMMVNCGDLRVLKVLADTTTQITDG